jgi:hypothetical protein
MEVKFDTSQVDKWIKNQQHRNNAMKLTSLLVANQSANNLRSRVISSNTSGLASNSLTTRVDFEGNQWVAKVISGVKYAQIAWETGRKPGRMPPMDQLRRWASLKLGNPNLAYAVAKKIARVGTRKHIARGPKHITNTIEWIGRFLFPKLLPKLLDEFTK